LHTFFSWHEGVTIWALVLTLFAIAEQTQQTSRATKAAEGAAVTASKALETQVSLSKAELRAYLVVWTAELRAISGEYWAVVTFKNCGQTPAYAFRGCLTVGVSEYPLPTLERPPEDLYGNSTIVGSQATHTVSSKRLFRASPESEAINIRGLTREVFFVGGCYKYLDIFKEEHTVNLRLVVGAPVAPFQFEATAHGYSAVTMVADKDGNDAD